MTSALRRVPAPPLPAALALLILLTGGACGAQEDVEHFNRCIGMAEPLVNTPDYIFPLTNRDVERVCKLWEEFVFCVKEYAMTYLTSVEQREFYEVIDASIKTVNQLCVNDPDYLRAYLKHAPCLRRVSTNDSLCGGQYHYMAGVVQGLHATDAQVCCAHLKFRECVLQRTPRECDEPGVEDDGAPSHFMRAMLDRALGYLMQMCQNFVPNARDCPRDTNEVTTGSSNVDGGFFPNQPDPDATTRGAGATPSSTTPFTRFTWTTSSTPRTTSDLSLGLAGNSLFGANSEPFRGSGNTVAPAGVILGAILAVALIMV